ncbi:MAG: cupredoxin domain-containing protein [Chloroflexi bacterium]|nr:cupredoxin domain-containing protein [Chloroflexota bacterium]
MSTWLILMVLVVASVASVIVLLAFRGRRPARAKLNQESVQEMTIVVNGRYQPDVVLVQQGVPVKLNFARNEDNPCSEWVIFSELSVRRRLPAYKTTPIMFTPNKAGQFLFTCQFGMYRGKLIVQKGNGRKAKATSKRELSHA